MRSYRLHKKYIILKAKFNKREHETLNLKR